MTSSQINEKKKHIMNKFHKYKAYLLYEDKPYKSYFSNPHFDYLLNEEAYSSAS